MSSPLQFSQVCSINFEPPDNDLCFACHVYPLSRGAWIISIRFILNRSTWGVELHDLMNVSNPVTFRVKGFKLSPSMKSQLTGIVQIQRDLIPKEKYFKIFRCLIITDSTLQSRSLPLCIFNCSLISTV